MKTIFLLFATLFLTFFASRSWANEPSKSYTLDRVRREYPIALRKLEAFHGVLNGEARKLTARPTTAPVTTRIAFAWDGDSQIARRWLMQEQPVARKLEKIECYNPRYWFNIERTDSSSSFSIKNYGTMNDLYNRSSMDIIIGDFITATHNLMGSPMSEMLIDPAFKMTGVNDTFQGGQKLLKITFERAGDFKNRRVNFQDGWLLLDPAQTWAISEWFIRRGSKLSPSTCKIEFGSIIDDIPLPRLVQLEHTGDAAAIRHELVFERIEPKHTPAAEFTLSSFGLPELSIPDSSAKASHMSWYFFVSACVLATLALGIKYWTSRSSHQTRV